MKRMKNTVGNAQLGFSLLEMIVAVAILGIAMSMLYKAAGGATRSVKVSEQYAYAVIMAQSLLDDNNVVPPNGVHYKGGSVNDAGFHWNVASSPVIFEESDVPALLHYISVSVSWKGGSSLRDFTLHSVVPVEEPAAEVEFSDG